MFYDKILSGNRNISCATCHAVRFGTGDGLSLGIGEGGQGMGPKRTTGEGADRIGKRIPRNAPPLWNLGLKSVDTLFHDGRIQADDIYGNGFNTPAEEYLPRGLNSILAAQALFPITSQFEMAGDPKENEVAGAVYDRINVAWPILAKRVRNNPEYADMFMAAFDDVKTPLDITIAEIANAIADFETAEFASYDAPFDAFIGGDDNALSGPQKSGMDIFFGRGGCSACHSGAFFSDQEFYAIAMPQFGPGRTRGFDPITRDIGRLGESDDVADFYRFRTPPLRNVELSAPYGHNGAYPTLEGVIRQHSDPLKYLDQWRPEMANLPAADWLASTDFQFQQNKIQIARLRRALDIAPVSLSDQDVSDLVAFMSALTGETSPKGRLGVPDRVPSGLTIDR